MEAEYKFTDKDKEWLAYELGMPIDEIEASIDDIEYVDIDKLEERPVWLRSVPTLDADGKQYLGAGIREYLEGL